jgi:hypothetical protein
VKEQFHSDVSGCIVLVIVIITAAALTKERIVIFSWLQQ